MAELDLSSKQVAEETGLRWGTLKNAFSGSDPLGLPSIYKVARVIARDGEDLRDVVSEIVARNDGVPSEPPKQPKGPKGPTRRQGKDSKGPRRDHDEVAA